MPIPFLNKYSSKKVLLLILPLFLLLLIFVRIYNIDVTARFTPDESSDLVRMHEYYQAKKITLVGPISNDHQKVFGSLTYYMLMPFAAVGNFEPVSPVYGMAFWGVLVAILLVLITIKINKDLLPYTIFLTLFWYPLLQTSRWAWNPHLVLFWIALGIWFYFRKTTISYFFSGISLSLAFHNHYIAVIATGIFVLLVCADLLRKKNRKQAGVLIGGYILPIIPFIIFDFRHPPGLFFSHYLMSGNIANAKQTTLLQVFPDMYNNFALFCSYITQNNFLAILIGIAIITIVVLDIKNNKKALLFFIPVLGQLFASAFLDSLETRYILPALVFLFVWLVLPRKKIGALVAKIALFVMMIGALFSFYPQLHTTDVQPTVGTIAKIDAIITNTIESKHIKNANIAALASPDLDTFALNIRDALQIRNINFLAASQYGVSEQLFVVSTSDETNLRKDKSFPMQQFKSAALGGVYPVENSSWKVYWFRKI